MRLDPPNASFCHTGAGTAELMNKHSTQFSSFWWCDGLCEFIYLRSGHVRRVHGVPWLVCERSGGIVFCFVLTSCVIDSTANDISIPRVVPVDQGVLTYVHRFREAVRKKNKATQIVTFPYVVFDNNYTRINISNTHDMVSHTELKMRRDFPYWNGNFKLTVFTSFMCGISNYFSSRNTSHTILRKG